MYTVTRVSFYSMTGFSGRSGNYGNFKVVLQMHYISRALPTAAMRPRVTGTPGRPSPLISEGDAALQLEVTENVPFFPSTFTKPLNSTQGQGSVAAWVRTAIHAVYNLSLCSQHS